MLSKSTLKELQEIFKEDYGINLPENEVRGVAETLVKYGELAIRVLSKKEDNNNKEYENDNKGQ